MRLFAFIFFLAFFSQPAQPTSPPPSVSEEEQQLIKARKANEEAQAEFYRMQTEKLREQPTPKSLWQSMKETPASLLGAFAALVALISFIYNYRATSKNQRDIQFYEALKRFGDKDSSTVRSSAAGILAQMGMLRAYQYTVLLKKPFIRRDRHQQYFPIALDQLITGLLLEEDLVCLTSITDALELLIPFDPKLAIKKLYTANQRLQNDLCVLLAKLWAAWGGTPPTDMLHRQWELAAHLAGTDKWVLKDFIARWNHLFSNSLERYSRIYTTLHEEEKGKILMNVEQSIEVASFRLSSNIALSCLALRQPLGQKKDELRFYGFFLVGGDLIDANLRFVGFGGSSHLTGVPFYGADLSEAGFVDAEMKGAGLFKANLTNAWLVRAHLEHAGLKEANLTGAKLHSAYIDDSTKLDGANWWEANFFHYIPAEKDNVDSALLDNLFRRYGDAIPKDLNALHPSVQIFLKNKKRDEPAKEKTVNDDSLKKH